MDIFFQNIVEDLIYIFATILKILWRRVSEESQNIWTISEAGWGFLSFEKQNPALGRLVRGVRRGGWGAGGDGHRVSAAEDEVPEVAGVGGLEEPALRRGRAGGGGGQKRGREKQEREWGLIPWATADSNTRMAHRYRDTLKNKCRMARMVHM